MRRLMVLGGLLSGCLPVYVETGPRRVGAPPPAQAQPARTAPVYVAPPPAAAAEPTPANHGQERREEVHERNAERKVLHQENKAEEKAQRQENKAEEKAQRQENK